MKERLVGAVVLVGLIVALVPEMLSGPRREPDRDAAADGSVRTFTIDLAQAPNSGAASATSTRLGPEPATPAAETTARPGSASREETSAPATQGPASAESAAGGGATAESMQAREGARTPTPTRDAEARARPTVEQPSTQSQTPSRPRAPTETGWAVQLGSFASRENAERLAAEVRKGGYRAFVSRFESGRSVRYRVRVGPEAQREQAEVVAQRLQRDGRQVSVVAHP